MPGINILSTTLHTMSKGASVWNTPQIDGRIAVGVLICCSNKKAVIQYCLHLLPTSGCRLLYACLSFASIMGSRFASLWATRLAFSCWTAAQSKRGGRQTSLG
jgi:hypothetical protein